jgi:hypothetical protein
MPDRRLHGPLHHRRMEMMPPPLPGQAIPILAVRREVPLLGTR